MKKYLLSLLALILGVGMLHANPVDLNRAKRVGQQFVENTLQSKADMTLAHTFTTSKGEAGFYVFNIGEEGFVIVSGNDFFRPIVGYSQEGAFDLNNPELNFFLGKLHEGREMRNAGQATPEVAAEWARVENYGFLLSKNGGRGVNYLVQSKWNQNPDPYNTMCPADAAGPGGHAYVGCVATAMSQLMNYWKYPLQGQGSHSYVPSDHPEYGTQTANFGATTYDWDNMLNIYGANYTPEQGLAVSTLCSHCGVAVNMNYGNTNDGGSGSNSNYVPNAMTTYFRYSSSIQIQNKPASLATWQTRLREQFDLGWPVYYSGSEASAPYGHAFICDGYNDADLFHFNFGWGGSGDGYFDIEGIDYVSGVQGIFNFVPAPVYDNTAAAPTNLTVTPGDNNALTATITWTNPSKKLNNSNLTSIDYVVVKRDNEIIAMVEDATPGAAMSYVDNEVPRFDCFHYQVYAVTDGNHGKPIISDAISIGPTCNWTVTVGSSDFLGWRGGYMTIYNAAGTLVKTITTSSSSPSNIQVTMPLGRVSFGWVAPSNTVSSMNFVIKDSNNQSVYSFSGPSTDLEEGIFFVCNNSCGNTLVLAAPTNLIAVLDEEDMNKINVSWEGVQEDGYGYNIYRDELLYRTIPDATDFVDHDVPDGGHCYYATFLSYGGDGDVHSNESCATAGEGCDAPRDLDYETTGAMFKIKLKWEKPENTEGLSGYFVYRKTENTEWKRIKMIGNPNTVTYTDNSLNEEGAYFYKVVSYYDATDCTSAPANWIYDNNQFYLGVWWSPTSVGEVTEGPVQVYPNPTKGNVTITGENLQRVMVYNTVGQLVCNRSCEGNTVEINLGSMESGLYMVKVVSENGETVKRISVIR